MTRRMRQLVTAIAAIAALATGGAVFAQAQNSAGTTPGTEQAGPENSEKGETPEKAETPGQEGSEVPNDDGPGGHADEPGNPNADHQFEGVE